MYTQLEFWFHKLWERKEFWFGMDGNSRVIFQGFFFRPWPAIQGKKLMLVSCVHIRGKQSNYIAGKTDLDEFGSLMTSLTAKLD